MVPPVTETLIRVGYLYKDTHESFVYIKLSDFADAKDMYWYVLNSRVANDKYLYDILTPTQKTYLYATLLLGTEDDIDLVNMPPVGGPP